MYQLSADDICQVTSVIDRADISYSHLRDDLVDHICCRIEKEIELGLDFNLAFEKVKVDFAIKDLQQVQERTLLLIDKNYSTMKTLMKISGIASTFLLMVGSLFKIYHWPGAGIILLLGFFALCFLFLPSANYVMHREKRDPRLIGLFISAFIGSFGFFSGILFKIQHWPGAYILSIIGILTLSLLFLPFLLRYLVKSSSSVRERNIYRIGIFSAIVYLIGFLCKMEHWPGASILLITGIIGLIGVFVPMYTRFKYATKERVEISYIYMIGTIAWFILVTMLVSITISRDVVNDFARSYNNTQLNIQVITEQNEALYIGNTDVKKDSLLSQVKLAANQMNQYLEKLEIELVQQTGEAPFMASNLKAPVDINLLKDRANSDISFHVMIGENGQGKASDLHKLIDDTLSKLTGIIHHDEKTSQLILLCLSTDMQERAPEDIQSWEDLYFDHSTLAATMNMLSLMQRNLKLAEQECIQFILTH